MDRIERPPENCNFHLIFPSHKFFSGSCAPICLFFAARVNNEGMKYFPVIADVLFYAACIFLLGFCVLRYFEMPVTLSAAVCALLALAGGLATFLIESRSRTKRYLSAKEQAERDAILMHLSLAPPEQAAASIASALAEEGRKSEQKGEELLLDGKPAELLFRMEPASADDLAPLIRRHGGNFILCCNTLSEAAQALIKRFPVEVIGGEEIYQLLKRTGKLPARLLGEAPPKSRHRDKLRAVFKKSNARPFFVSGALLLIMSLFTLFPVYYLITGSILLLLSAGLRLLAPA